MPGKDAHPDKRKDTRSAGPRPGRARTRAPKRAAPDFGRNAGKNVAGAVGDGVACLEELAARIAHEIRNPLSGINLNTASLEKLVGEAAALDDETRRAARDIVKFIRNNSDRIEAVVRRVMAFSRLRAPRFVRSDLNRCVAAAIELSATALGRNGIRVRTHLAEGLPALEADPRLLGQALANLLANAADAVSEVDGPKEIDIVSGAEDGRLVVRVADSGPGVPESIREKIFSPFFTTRQGGTGIGLPFVHRVIAEHRGTVTVGTSHLGGAEFRIELPLAQPRAIRAGCGGRSPGLPRPPR